MVIAGAGAVGRSVAQSLLATGHRVLLIESRGESFRPQSVPDADWLWADACELAALEAAGLRTCDAVIATTGDDKVNLVCSLLSKLEFAVPHVIARINDTGNSWLFTEWWGVDVGVSTPSTMAAVVEATIRLT